MDIGTALSAAQTLFAALGCLQLKEILSSSVYKSKLEVGDLKLKIEIIRAVLRDAENKEELSHQEKVQIEELKDAVFDADDLLDEFVTLALKKQLLEADGRLSEKIRCFFSNSNPLAVYRRSQRFEKFKMKLRTIASNTSYYINPEPIRNRRLETCSYVDSAGIIGRRLETCSYVDSAGIIGRKDDLEKIVSMLFASNVEGDVTFLSIVGIGGLGKTALAQLVYNDPRVVNAFPLKLWTYVSDEAQTQLDIAGILQKMALATGNKHEGSTMEQVQSKLREKLEDQRYMLILDDVWTEKRDRWSELVKYLIGGQKGSWIVVTTRSQKTATIVGGQTYELRGLSEENSWRLFRRTAFGSEMSNSPDNLQLVEIGREIVTKCAQVPLAIKVVGSLLYGQAKSEWESVQRNGLASIRESENGIIPILKLSFDHLDSPLKSCFSYCALFPKDFVFYKEDLIRLWMAQGYIVPRFEGQSLEDAGEEYFSILLKRCFFQDIKKYGKLGEIVRCKIHDLMHDISQSVSGKEIYATDTIGGNLDKKVRHVSVAFTGKYGKYSWGRSGIRSLFAGSYFKVAHRYPFPMNTLEETLASSRCLRALELSKSNIKRLPKSIGELLHLRYLDLSYSNLEELPKSITKLYNLQTLNLAGCRSLKELPKDLSKLVKLRYLDIKACDKLEYMPRDMSKLSCLRELSDFIVGGKGSCLSWKQWFYGLEDLKALRNLTGSLEIRIMWPDNVLEIVKDDSRREGLYLTCMEHLNVIKFYFTFVKKFSNEEGVFRYDSEVDRKMDEEAILSLMEDLQPHSNLKLLSLTEYHGVILPGWVSLLTNLVYLDLDDCEWLKYFPCLRYLPHLRSLSLDKLASLEYVEEESLLFVDSEKKVSYFPSLEQLVLLDLPKLKEWKIEVGDSSSNSQLISCLSKLKKVIIGDCPELTCIPVSPSSAASSNPISLRVWGTTTPSSVIGIPELTYDD